MGEAKRRGTYEERKAAALDIKARSDQAMCHVLQRRPSPKHVALLGVAAALIQAAKSGYKQEQ